MSLTPEQPTGSADRVPLPTKLAYSAGVLVNNLQAAAIPAMMVILNLGLEMKPWLVGIVASAPRAFDALTDPVMGYISDQTQTRWGRRRPFIFCGALLAGTVFALMWQVPPGRSEEFYFIAFICSFVLYFVCYSLFATPIIALGYELTADYDERTRLHAFANTIGQLAWLSVPWFYALMANKNLFTDKVAGARTLAIVVGATIVCLGILPAIFCRERALATAPAKPSSAGSDLKGISQHLLQFIMNFRTTLRCRPFVKLCTATFLVFNSYSIGISFTLYVLIYYVYSGNEDLAGVSNGWFGTLTAACTLLSIPAIGWTATRVGKREAFTIAMTLSLIGYVIKWFGYNPNHPDLLLLSCPFIAFGNGTLFTLMSSMVADVCDYDELQTNSRREGMYGAIFWWMVKIGIALAGLASGALLEYSGFDVEAASQPQSTLQLMRLFDVAIPFVATALAIWIMSTYEITEKEAVRIRAELEARRGVASTNDSV